MWPTVVGDCKIIENFKSQYVVIVAMRKADLDGERISRI